MAKNQNGLAFAAVLQGLDGKCGFRVVQEALRRHDLESAGGWQQLQEKLSEASGDDAEKAYRVLVQLLTKLNLAGTKEVQLYEIDREDINGVRDTLLDLVAAAEHPYCDAFPLPLDESALKTLDGSHQLVEKVAAPNGDVSLIFCARRSHLERTRYGIKEVTAEVQKAFAGYDEFIALRHREYQVFDVVTLRPKLNRLEILIDQPDRIRDPETVEDRCLTLLALVAPLSTVLTQVFETNQPINLFPCINSMYARATEGRVSKLSFRAPTKSVIEPRSSPFS